MAAKKGAPAYSRQPPTTATRPASPLRAEAVEGWGVGVRVVCLSKSVVFHCVSQRSTARTPLHSLSPSSGGTRAAARAARSAEAAPVAMARAEKTRALGIARSADPLLSWARAPGVDQAVRVTRARAVRMR